MIGSDSTGVFRGEELLMRSRADPFDSSSSRGLRVIFAPVLPSVDSAFSQRTCNVDSLERLRLLERTRSRVLRQTFFHLETVFLRAEFHTQRETVIDDDVASRRDQTSLQWSPIPPEQSGSTLSLCIRCHSFQTLLFSLRDPFPLSPWSLTALIDSFSPRRNSCCRSP